MANKDKKILLVFPPQWTPVSPFYSLAYLQGQLKNEGYNVESMDLNVEFYNEILSKEYLKAAVEKMKHDYLETFRNIRKIYTRGKKEKRYSLDEQCELYKYNKIKEFMATGNKYYEILPDNIQDAVNTVRSKEDFYQPEKLIKAVNIIDYALKIVSLAWAPMNIEFEACWHSFMKLNYKTIRHFVFDRKSNIFWDFHKKNVEKIKEKNPSFVAISLVSTSQLISGLTLAHLIKKYTSAHVNLAGNFFSRIKNELKKHPEFSEFCDSVTFLDGENQITKMAQYVNEEIKIDKVPNFLYFKDGKVLETESVSCAKLNDIPVLNLDGLDLTKYYSPEIIMPYETSRGCYWGKCTFCDQGFGREFNTKNIGKVISEMRELKEKYGITRYEFIDESVSPVYLNDLANAINKTDINPEFFIDARLETQFTEEILEKSYKAGLRMIMWGLESGSRRIMEAMNKGIDLDRRFEILKLANKYGIWNFAFIFFGYPLETMEDARETIKMLADNHEIINSYGRSVFSLGKHSKISEEPEKHGILKMTPDEDEFSPNIQCECVGMTQKELNQILQECRASSFVHYKNPLWMFLRYREWLFLYIAKYGLDWVSKYSVEI